jgi:hypothetical protein
MVADLPLTSSVRVRALRRTALLDEVAAEVGDCPAAPDVSHAPRQAPEVTNDLRVHR